jgi:hypothetical protein
MTSRAGYHRPSNYRTELLAVQVRIELIRVYLALADLAGARTLMREIDEILTRRPDLGTLVGTATELRMRLTAERAPRINGASSLTTAELRVLPMLATHLSFPEIGAKMYLSVHTIKRPTEEYRTPTDEEWQQFLGHFERRKVSAGLCGRAFAAPCIHEHACIRCPMLWPDPAQRPRIAEIATT